MSKTIWKRIKRRPYHHGDLRRDLLRVAREEIGRNGAHLVTLASLASLAGVSQPAPYRHFADRKALLEGVAAEGFEELAQVLCDAAVVESKPHEALLGIALAYVRFGETNIELYRLMFASRLVPEAKPESALGKAADGAFELLRAAVAAVFATQVEDNALMIWAQLHGLVMLRADSFIRRPLSEFVDVLNSLEKLKATCPIG